MRRIGLAIGIAIWVLALVSPTVGAADPPTLPDPVEGQSAYDDGLLGPGITATIEQIGDAMATLNHLPLTVVARQLGGPVADPDAEAERLAETIVDTWDVATGVVIVVVAESGGCGGGAAVRAAEPLQPDIDPDRIVADTMRPALARCDVGTAAVNGAAEVLTSLAGFGEPDQPTSAPAGPPFPDPEIDRAVYDQAGVFSPGTVEDAERTIDAIENRTGAEVVVYSQVVDYGITTEEADGHARDLMDQWGIGRKGFDDGLVILFDLDPSLIHGQVILYGGPGYRAAYLDNGEKQRIFDEEMLPKLREGDLDGALRIALQRVDENATPEHAAKLQTARQIDAAIGLVGAPIILFGLLGSAVFAWLRYGRDPVYLDDPSIHMAGPPRELTPAAAAFVVAGHPTRRALTAAMLDLASRGRISFREEKELFGLKKKVGIELEPAAIDPMVEARRARNDARPLGPAEELAARKLSVLGDDDGYIEPDELLKFGSSVDDFNQALETHVVDKGWFREKPSKATGRWAIRGGIAAALGAVAIFGGISLPSAGLVLLGGALIVSGVGLLVMSRFMEAVTIPGSMIRAMLAAYRRTLQKTMDQSRSMDQVVADAGLPWLETPDQAVVWGTALGLEHEVEDVLSRSIDDVKQGRASAGATYVPFWYGTGGADGSAGIGGGGGGLFSSSAVPDFGGMMSALGTIGNSPSSSGSGGGFGGGGSGGGGGGSGGGF